MNNIGVVIENSRIPSKQALCEVFGISRPVVGAAWGAMASDRWIVKLPRTTKGPVVWAKTFEFTR
jgi:GntR family transcriptional regulator